MKKTIMKIQYLKDKQKMWYESTIYCLAEKKLSK